MGKFKIDLTRTMMLVTTQQRMTDEFFKFFQTQEMMVTQYEDRFIEL